MCREIKQATSQMLRNIYAAMQTGHNRIYDKDIAKLLDISKTIYSNLLNKKTTPGIMLWYRIINLHREKVGIEKTNEIIENVH